MTTGEKPGRRSGAETFDSAFSGDPLAGRYRQFADRVAEAADATSLGRKFVELGRLGYELLIDEYRASPGTYDRGVVLKKMGTALRLSGIPESMVRPHEIVALYWVARLDRSIPGGRRKPRSFRGDEIPAEWYGDGVRLSALRLLAACISRAGKSGELDAWEYKPGMEPISREILARLRAGSMTTVEVEAAIRDRRERIKAEHDEARNPRTAARRRAARIAKLEAMAAGLARLADKEFARSREALRDFLEARGVIPATPRLGIRGLARVLTPADARVLVQELAAIAESDPSRAAVIRSLGFHAGQAPARSVAGNEARRLPAHA